MQILVLIAVVVVIIIAVIYNIKRKRDKANVLKGHDVPTLTTKYKSNEQLKIWAHTLAEITKNEIAANRYFDFELYVMPYPNAINYGYNLQKVYYEHIKELADNPKAVVLSQFNFSEHNLPDIIVHKYTDYMIQTINTLTALSLAVAELVVEELKAAGYDVKNSDVVRIIDQDGCEVSQREGGEAQFNIQCIKYKPPRATGSW